ncbi:hypothetical protein F4859DRAFT_499445 [Xylaria cf. heliscus]|nr:hypothetical protein F4859DRAFT_499445 [Xylaria cf. heliscus]
MDQHTQQQQPAPLPASPVQGEIGSSESNFNDIIKKWTSDQGLNFKENLRAHVTGLYTQIIAERKKEKEKESSRKSEASGPGIFQLLGKEGLKHCIDDCILWVILLGVVARDPSGYGEVEAEVTKEILEHHPYLAFENLNTSPLADKCPFFDDQRHIQCWELKTNKSTPFHEAASLNNVEALGYLITAIENYSQQVDKNPETLRQYPPWLNASLGNNTQGTLLLQIVRGNLACRNNSALDLAAEAESGDGETLECLLTRIPDIVDKSEGTFASVVETGKVEIVAKFLKHGEAHKLFAQSKHIIEAIKLVPSSDHQQHHRRLDIVKRLLETAKKNDSAYFDLEVAGAIIERDLLEIWDSLFSGVSDPPCGLLHLAVQHGKLQFVQNVLNVHPEFVTKKSALPMLDRSDRPHHAPGQSEYYPLWYNNNAQGNYERNGHSELTPLPDYGKRNEIRSEIITHTVRQVRTMKVLSEILAESGEPARELCFDLSHINFQFHLVSEFVQSLINHSENEDLFQYEETLQYAEFPGFDTNPHDRDQLELNKYFPVEHKEVFQILDWLETSKGVKRIMSFKVPDRLVNPHSEVKIAEKAALFKVEVLDWRLLDMSISIFGPEVREILTELSLYSSGKRAVISHWLSENGVPSLRNLKLLYIYVVKETSDEKSCRVTVKYIRDEFKKKLKENRGSKLEYDNIRVEAQFWNPVQQMENLDEIAKRVAPKLSRFIGKYRWYAFERARKGKLFRPTKVAIIDNGILSIPKWNGKLPEEGDHPLAQEKTSSAARVEITTTKANEKGDGPGFQDTTNNGYHAETATKKYEAEERDRAYFLANKSVSSRVKGGRSFVDESYKQSPWHLASNPHGTQMANLICAIDPLCELYVAKVHDGQYGMTPGRVARAIEWAITQGVDVISMSFTITSNEEDHELKRALDNAGSKGIAILCSAHDEGTKVNKAWPADHEGNYIIVVAACDEYGRILREMRSDKYYMFHGKNVAAGAIPFLQSNDRITGSSVATALAAGLSSLTLACDRMVDPDERIHKGNDRGYAPSIKKRFDSMTSTKDSKYVLLDKFAGIDRVRVGQESTAEGILKGWSTAWEGLDR